MKDKEIKMISVKERLPERPGWYLVYAPTYEGGSSSGKEIRLGYMFARFSVDKKWSVEQHYYKRPGLIEAWLPLPALPPGVTKWI